MYKIYFWSIAINYFLISSTYIYTFLRVLFEDILFPSGKTKTKHVLSTSVILFYFRCGVYVHYSSFDGVLKSHISYRWRFEISRTDTVYHCHWVYEGPNRVRRKGGGKNRRAFVLGSLNSVKAVLSSLFISLLFFLVRWTQITHTLCGCLVGESITTRRYQYNCTNTAIWYCRQNWPYLREQ